jgi:hypothetical protein
LRQEAFYTEEDIQWFNPSGGYPDWFDGRQKCLACLVRGQDGPDLYLMFNVDTDAIGFVLPPCSSGHWRVAVDTFQVSPGDVYLPGEEPLLRNPNVYVVESRSSVVLVAK